MTHSATVSWTAPVQNTDGTPLTDVAGYVISFGTSPTRLTKSIVVSDPGLTTGTVRALPAGTYYFSVATRNSSGVLSNGSTVVSKTVPKRRDGPVAASGQGRPVPRARGAKSCRNVSVGSSSS